MRDVNQAGIELIKHFEGCFLKPYLCPAGVLTVGYGHTGPDVIKGKSITAKEAEELLKKDLLKFSKAISERVKVSTNDNQFSALVSLTYNIGLGNLYMSTLLKLLNRGDYVGAGNEFLKWNRANGKVLVGLTKRREAERILYHG